MNYKQLQKFLNESDNPTECYSEYERFMTNGERYINVTAYLMPEDMHNTQDYVESLRIAACNDDSKADEYVESLLSLYHANIRKAMIIVIDGKPEVIRLQNTVITRGIITPVIYEKLEEAFKDYITSKEFLFTDLMPYDDTVATIPGIQVKNLTNHFVLSGG